MFVMYGRPLASEGQSIHDENMGRSIGDCLPSLRISLVTSPPSAPEFNSVEYVWDYLRANRLTKLLYQHYRNRRSLLQSLERLHRKLSSHRISRRQEFAQDVIDHSDSIRL
jgi:hypothetical protein